MFNTNITSDDIKKYWLAKLDPRFRAELLRQDSTGDLQRLAAEPELSKHKVQVIEKLRHGAFSPNSTRTVDLASGATSFNTTKDWEEFQAKDVWGEGITKVSGAELVKARAACASHCQKDGRDVQGRTSCKYCGGEGFISKSSRENQPSRSVNKLQKSLGPGSCMDLIKRGLDSGDPDRIAKLMRAFDAIGRSHGFRVGSVEELRQLHSELEMGKRVL